MTIPIICRHVVKAINNNLIRTKLTLNSNTTNIRHKTINLRSVDIILIYYNMYVHCTLSIIKLRKDYNNETNV